VVTALRAERPSRHMQLHFVKEGDGYAEAFFARFLIEVRLLHSASNVNYLFHALNFYAT